MKTTHRAKLGQHRSRKHRHKKELFAQAFTVKVVEKVTQRLVNSLVGMMGIPSPHYKDGYSHP